MKDIMINEELQITKVGLIKVSEQRNRTKFAGLLHWGIRFMLDVLSFWSRMVLNASLHLPWSVFVLQSPMFDGKVPHWHHFSCFWQRASAQSPSDIGGFSDLRWEDQEKVKKAIESGGATGGECASFSIPRGDGVKWSRCN